MGHYRLRHYRLVSLVLFPRSIVAKILTAAFVGIHIPLLAFVGYVLVTASQYDREQLLAVSTVTLVATVLGAAVTLYAIYVLLCPLSLASQALRHYRKHQTLVDLPVDLHHQAGQLLGDIQDTLVHVDEMTRVLTERSLRDPLTALPNRRAGEERLAEELTRFQQSGSGLTLVVIDADGLKNVNDEYGHGAGDAYLKHLARCISCHLPGTDWVARWGGDEFIVVMPDREDRRVSPTTLLRRIRDDLATTPAQLLSGSEVWASFSAGLADSRAGDTIEHLFNRADLDLYQAKEARADCRRGAPTARYLVVRRERACVAAGAWRREQRHTGCDAISGSASRALLWDHQQRTSNLPESSVAEGRQALSALSRPRPFIDFTEWHGRITLTGGGRSWMVTG